MSQTLRNGFSKDLAIQPGEILLVAAPSGSYSASIIAGVGAGTAIATSATGGTYGPYAAGVVVRLQASAISEVDYDLGTAPAIASDTPVMASTNLTGEIRFSFNGLESPVMSLAVASLFANAGSVTNKTVFTTAVAANAVKVAYVGHSIAAGNNQNFYGASVWNLLRRALSEAFPSAVFTWGNYGLGGKDAGDFLGNPNTTITAPATTQYRENWQNDSGALTSAASWANKVAAFQPDLMFLQFDLNETSASTFATNIQAIIDDIAVNARWTSKRPSIVLVSSHTGKDNGGITQSIVRQCHKALRTLARKNKLPLLDAGRVYDLLTTGIDPASLIPYVSGEIALAGRVTAAGNLPTAFYESKVGTAYSPTGTTVRHTTGGQPLLFYRSRLATDGAVQGGITPGGASAVPSLFYRADPNDANYATGTGKQYEIRVTGTTVQAYFWVGGSAVAISGATVTLTNGVAASLMQIRVEYKDGCHTATIYAPSNEIKVLEFFDCQYIGPGYVGWGVYGAGGGSWNVGTGGGIQSDGCIVEFWDSLPAQAAPMTDSALVGAVSDWATTPASTGGNAINHLTNLGYKLIYEPAALFIMRQLQS
jgi:hypothetical protein